MNPNTLVFFASVLTLTAFACGGESDEGDASQAGTGGATPGAGGANGTTAGAGGAAGSATAGGAGGGMPSAGANNAGEGGSPSELVACDPRLIVCKRVAPSCAQGEVPSVEGSCYGPCVPIERCGCDEPADCPDNATYTCWNFGAHCGPYVR